MKPGGVIWREIKAAAGCDDDEVELVAEEMRRRTRTGTLDGLGRLEILELAAKSYRDIKERGWATNPARRRYKVGAPRFDDLDGTGRGRYRHGITAWPVVDTLSGEEVCLESSERKAQATAKRYNDLDETKPTSNPAASSAAVDMYRGFQGFEPRKVGAFGVDFKIPTHATCVGPALNVMYRSDKNDPSTGKPVKKPIDYIHDHEDGVHVYRTDAAARGERVVVPTFIREVEELVKLGDCLGFTYDTDEGAIEAAPTRPLPELYTIPSGRALLVVQDKRKVLALIWGGRLGVEPRGIVY